MAGFGDKLDPQKTRASRAENCTPLIWQGSRLRYPDLHRPERSARKALRAPEGAPRQGKRSALRKALRAWEAPPPTWAPPSDLWTSRKGHRPHRG